MEKAYKIAISLAFALLTLWILWSSLQSTRPSIQNYSETAENRSTSSHSIEEREKPEEALARYTWWLTAFTCVLAFATIGLGAATLWLCLASERQFRLARDEFVASHRPKIRIKHVVLARDIWHEEPIVVNLTCVNTGTADALLGQLGIRYEIVRTDRNLPMDPGIPAIFNYGGGRLACGRNWTVDNIDTGRVLTPEENADIQQRRADLHCIGYVSYLDASDRMRITGFCRVLVFPEDALADVQQCRWRVFPDPDYEYED
jgi:hypothetical protein